MRVWLLTVGEPLPGEGGRLHRAGQLAGRLVARGHDVTWWTSRFDHFTKRHRPQGGPPETAGEGYRLRLLDSRGYRRNRSIARLIDHAQVARAFRRASRFEPRPDLVLASFPTVDCASAAVDVGTALGVPTVLDIRDLWPDVLVEGLPAWLGPLPQLAAAPMRRQAKRALSAATAICAITKSYLAWALELANRARGPFDCVYPLGYELYEEDHEPAEWDAAVRNDLGIPADDRPVVCFAGTIGHHFDLATVLEATRLLEGVTPPPRWIFCGDGELLDWYRANRTDDSVLWTSRLDARQLRAVMKRAAVGLAPYRQSENFASNVPNKIIEYLGNALPIVSCLGGETARLLSDNDCGISYSPGDPLSLAKAIATAMNPERHDTMARNAETIYWARFTAEAVYGAMIEHLEVIARESELLRNP